MIRLSRRLFGLARKQGSVPSLKFDVSRYKKVYFIDTQVILEGRPLEDLPWSELDPAGPILVLASPTMLAEVDKFKRDGRVGQRARVFNRLIGPSASSGVPINLQAGSPAVDLGIAICDRIDWSSLPDLDRDSGDDKIVAEALHASSIPFDRRIVLSYDIRPISAAARHGLQVARLPEHWLLPPEPGPAEKEIQRLKQQVTLLKAQEPEFAISISFPDVPDPLVLRDVQPLARDRCAALYEKLLKPKQYGPGIQMRDPSYEDNYEKYKEELGRYLAEANQRLSLLFNQLPISIVVENVGAIQAEHLRIELASRAGTINDKIFFPEIFGPTVPRPDPLAWSRYETAFPIMPLQRGRHEVYFDLPVDRATSAIATCEDFRHGTEWRLDGSVIIDPGAALPFSIRVRVTAGNMRGEQTYSKEISFSVRTTEATDLLDFENKKLIEDFPIRERLVAADKAKRVRMPRWKA